MPARHPQETSPVARVCSWQSFLLRANGDGRDGTDVGNLAQHVKKVLLIRPDGTLTQHSLAGLGMPLVAGPGSLPNPCRKAMTANLATARLQVHSKQVSSTTTSSANEGEQFATTAFCAAVAACKTLKSIDKQQRRGCEPLTALYSDICSVAMDRRGPPARP